MATGNGRSNTIKIRNENLTRKIVHQIGKFAILWNVFEDEKCNNRCNNNVLRQIAPSLTNINLATLKNFAIALQGRVDIRANGIEEYVEYILVPDNACRMNPRHAEDVKRFIETDGQKSLAGGLIAIYRIRNNMFHGLKELQSLDGQIELFKAMNKVLESCK